MGSRGRFVVLEGGEGAGKSTQAELLARRLGALLTREPGGTALGECVRAVLLDPAMGPLEPRAELLLMVAARAQHVAQVIRPALASGRDVVCDRFSGSTLAYQGHGRGLPISQVELACDLAADGLVPDLTILIEVGREVAESRRTDVPDRIESEERAFHERVREGFSALALARGWAVVDGEGTRDEVEAAVAVVVERFASAASGGHAR